MLFLITAFITGALFLALFSKDGRAVWGMIIKFLLVAFLGVVILGVIALLLYFVFDVWWAADVY